MKRKDLLLACENIIKTFDPTITTVDAHASDTLGSSENADSVFIRQVLYGCVRYKQVLKIFLSTFYHDNSGRTSRNDYTMYMILSYLYFFRLREVGFKNMEAFVQTQDPSCMHIFLSYIFDREKMNGAIRAEWLRILDSDYIDTKIFQPMEQVNVEAQSFLDRLKAKAFGVQEVAQDECEGINKSFKSTIPQAPKLSKPKARKIPEPIRIGQVSTARPVPDLNKTTLSDLQGKNEKRKQEAHEKTAEKYANAKEFKFQQIRSNLEEIREKVELERQAELKFDGFRAKPVPTYPETGANVKLNVASILREDALYKKKQEKEAQLIEAYEADLRDSTEFYRWQTQMLKKDDEKAKEQVERRRLEMVQSQQIAIEASLRAKEENRKVAVEMRHVSKSIEENRQMEKEQHDEANRLIVEEIKQVREVAPRAAEEKVKQENQKKREELNAILAEEWERKKEQDLIEKTQREDLIRQIRALDRVHREHVAVFDPTESSNVGLLEEMSLVELRERLQIQKVKQAELEVERRQAILENKAKKESSLRQRMENIIRIRRAAADSNRTARTRRKKNEMLQREKEKAERDAGNLQLAKKLELQRQSRMEEIKRLEREEEEIGKQRMFLGAAKSQLEATHFQQLLQGAERQAAERQRTAQEAAHVYEQVQLQETNERKKQQQKSLRQRRKFHEKKAVELEDSRVERLKQSRVDSEERKSVVQAEKTHYTLQTQLQRQRNPYATKQSDKSIARGRLKARSSC